jgi:hypothetical protein
MTLTVAFAIAAVCGAVAAGLGVTGLRASGADMSTARRLARAREIAVGALESALDGPARPVRVSGRIRCRDPLRAPGGERLVAYHRDVEVRLASAGWRTVERVRETRSFELWDHEGAVSVDPARAAEPLLSLPSVWRGSPTELVEPHASAVARLAERGGEPTEARATTRSISVTDRLLVVGIPARAGGRAALEPGAAGYLITNLALPDAMRLLGGTNRRLTSRSIVLLGVGTAAVVLGLAGVVATVLAGATG